VIGRLRHLDHAADVGHGLALGDQLLGGFELADDLFGCVPGAFHGRDPGPVWPAENSHSPRTGFQGPRQQHGRPYLCVCVHSDVYRQVRQLSAEHQLSFSGAAHHLLRLGAGLEPLLRLPSAPSTLKSKSHGD
jgi:hypothetical protein